MMTGRITKTKELTEEQEREIVDDPVLLLVAVCVLNKLTLAEIVDQYSVSETELTRKIAHLDRLHIIELLPKNRIKLLIPRILAGGKTAQFSSFSKRKWDRNSSHRGSASRVRNCFPSAAYYRTPQMNFSSEKWNT
jgi:hypothetical protein